MFGFSGSKITGLYGRASYLRKRGGYTVRTGKRASDFKHEGHFRSERGVKKLVAAAPTVSQRIVVFGRAAAPCAGRYAAPHSIRSLTS